MQVKEDSIIGPKQAKVIQEMAGDLLRVAGYLINPAEKDPELAGRIRSTVPFRCVKDTAKEKELLDLLSIKSACEVYAAMYHSAFNKDQARRLEFWTDDLGIEDAEALILKMIELGIVCSTGKGDEKFYYTRLSNSNLSPFFKKTRGRNKWEAGMIL